MYETNIYTTSSNYDLSSTSLSGRQISARAYQLFRTANLRCTLMRLWNALTRGCRCLKLLDEALGSGGAVNAHSLGTKTVPIRQICGTLGRAHDFDREFNPMREADCGRWMRLAIARLRGETLPAVDLVEVNGSYYVRDGHHRISVARALGEQFIDAEITQFRIRRTFG